MGKVILVFSAILFSGLFLVTQNAYAFTEWDWNGGGATNNWSDIGNWECYTSDAGDPIVCPAPGYPDTLLEDPSSPDLAIIFGATVTIDVPVVVEPIAEILIHASTITNNSILTIQRDGLDIGMLRFTQSTFTNAGTITNSGETTILDSHFTNSGQIINSATGEFTFNGAGSNTWVNSAAGVVTNDDELNIGALEFVQNSGTITNNVGSLINNAGEIINQCTGQFIGTLPNGKSPKDNCAFSDGDNIPDAIEELLTGANNGLSVNPGNQISTVNYSFDADSNIIFEGQDGGGSTIANWTLPSGTTSTGSISVTYSTSFFGPSTTISGVTVPYPPGKTLSLKATSPTANKVCFRDQPSGLTQTPPFFGNCFENIGISRVGMDCPTSPSISTRTVSGFPDAPFSRDYTCQAIDIGPDRFLEITGLAFSEAGEFTDADNDGINDACVGLSDTDNDGVPDECEDDPPEINEPPVITASLTAIKVEKDEGLFQVIISANDDNDLSPTISSDINGVTILSGDILKLEVDDKTESQFKEAKDKQCEKDQQKADKKLEKGKEIGSELAAKLLICDAGGIYQIKAPDFTVTITATDSDGASSTTTIVPTFESSDDDRKHDDTKRNDDRKHDDTKRNDDRKHDDTKRND